MSPLLSEIFKAAFIVAIFACVCGVVRSLTVRHLPPRLKAALTGFLSLLLLPTSYLYLSLAFPSAAAVLLPLQSFAIWLYGPVLLWILHAVTHQRVRAWQGCLYGGSLFVGATFLATTYAGRTVGAPWWQLLSLAQAVLFAVAALVWTVRRRAQLRILVTEFSNSSFAPLLYLSLGILALLSFDFVVHTRTYLGAPLPEAQFYSWVAPCALYTLGISLWLIWQPRADADVPLSTLKESPAPESVSASNTRRLELTPTAARDLAQLLDAQMREKRLYTLNDLSLTALASSLGVSTHIASEPRALPRTPTYFALRGSRPRTPTYFALRLAQIH